MVKTNVFLFATHHTAGNIAAQRYRGLLKYLDKDKYRVFVFAMKGAQSDLVNSPGVHLVETTGACVGKETSKATSAIVFASAFISAMPYWRLWKGLASRSWLVSALCEAESLCANRIAANEPCVAIGTYSPVDALVAASCLAKRHSIPCAIDFRDGLVFESLGRSGWLWNFIRRVIEWRLVSLADMVISVSEPLVDYFRRRYHGKRIGFLPNGYDAGDFKPQIQSWEYEKIRELADRYRSPKGLLLGHFGRIGASDRSASKSLEEIIPLLNKLKEEVGEFSLLLVGEITSIEKEALKGADFKFHCTGHIKRDVAIGLMKSCDMLILLTGDRKSCATGKLYEYMAAKRPVLHFTQEPLNEAAKILQKTGVGATFDDSTDHEAVRQFILNSAKWTPSVEVDIYRKDVQALKLQSMLEDLLHSERRFEYSDNVSGSSSEIQ